MADEKDEDTEEARPGPRRQREETARPAGGDGRRDAGDRPRPAAARAEARPPPQRNGRRGSATAAARTAAADVAELTGHQAEAVTSVERSGEGWKVSVEVVETERIPDTASILATYDVVLDGDGELTSYRRTHRYARGQLRGESR